MYVDHVIKKYKDPVIAFDNYPELLAIKDVTHLRRTKGIVSPNINFTPTMPCKTQKELFMSNSHNKQAFINMLCEKLNEHDIRYKNAVDDADLLIAQTAVDCVLSSEVIVIGEDTDLLVLLIHHVNQQCKWVIFKSDKMAINNKNENMNIQQTKDFLGEDICHLLPFLHSLTGCDSTSRLFGIGKGIALKRLNQEDLKSQGQLFMNTTSSKLDVIIAGE
jgi:5'-3' exonuclease